MPTYDYRCQSCEHQFEHFQGMSDPHLKKCPECGKRKLERLIGTGAGLIFKGSGFYITDYRGDSYQKAADKESSAGSDDSGKTDKSAKAAKAAKAEKSTSKKKK